MDNTDRNSEIFSVPRILQGSAIAVISFVALGTVAALWDNPLFVRMTPADTPELFLLMALALFTGLFFTVRRPVCAGKSASAAGVLGFLGVACPVCNKVLLYLFGSELLLTYFEPIRVYVAAGGVLLMAWLVVREYRMWGLISSVPVDGSEVAKRNPG